MSPADMLGNAKDPVESPALDALGNLDRQTLSAIAKRPNIPEEKRKNMDGTSMLRKITAEGGCATQKKTANPSGWLPCCGEETTWVLLRRYAGLTRS